MQNLGFRKQRRNNKMDKGDMEVGINEAEFHASILSNHILPKHLQIKINT
jgi:hypothetical protein